MRSRGAGNASGFGFGASFSIISPGSAAEPATWALNPFASIRRHHLSASVQRRTRIMVATMVKLLKNEDGATAIEYGLIAALVALVIVGAVTSVGTSVTGIFTKVASSL
jgi:pilus assembly protein Flp/PilA